MSQTAIQVENLSKQYRLGMVGTGTLKHDINRFWHQIRGLEDPYLKLGQANDRSQKAMSDYVWALRDIDFKVMQGDVLGIIGRNGAGKSTLLKILSKITAPTTGQINVKGRIASLLEVGTGFHPELSGRENIFMNGSILGMRKWEIQSKFDEIVDFSGVEGYIDTPVKRYSSGMYVRLAFSVAAFLEPEILIVDEVLAVGDAEFQKKCMGRMKDVSTNHGRTILFVSHNIAAVKSLCNKGLFLMNGEIMHQGGIDETIEKYLISGSNKSFVKKFDNPETAPGNEFVKVKSFEAFPMPRNENTVVTINTPIEVEFEFWNYVTDKPINLSMHVYTNDGVCVFNCITESRLIKKGVHKGICQIPGKLLNANMYYITMMIVAEAAYPLYNFEDGISLEINEDRIKSAWHGKWPGLLRPNLSFTLHEVNS